MMQFSNLNSCIFKLNFNFDFFEIEISFLSFSQNYDFAHSRSYGHGDNKLIKEESFSEDCYPNIVYSYISFTVENKINKIET